jgi:integrase
MLISHVETYLSLRRALGFDLRNDALLLRSFAKFADERKETHVNAGTATEWAAQASSAAQRDRRLKAVIRFARHLRLEDNRHQIPPGGVFGYHQQRPVPYIFKKAQVKALVDQVACLPSSDPSRSHTCSTLFGLLAATGLRISEALALRLDDLTANGLLIRKTKFHKSRILPLHETTARALENYRLYHRPKVDNDHLFVSADGKKLSYFIARATLRAVARCLKLPARAARLHNFRHTFAVRALEVCPEGRQRVAQHMLAVSTYLGHARVSDTFWYLRSTPQLMIEITEVSERFLKGGTA